MAQAKKPNFVFRRNWRVHLNRPRGASVQSTTGSRGVRISGSNAGYAIFRGSVNSTGYPLHSPVFPSLRLPCVTVCHHISNGLYLYKNPNVVLPTTQKHNVPLGLTYNCAPTCQASMPLLITYRTVQTLNSNSAR